METWKDVPHYEGKYQVSSFGRVRSVDRWEKHGRWEGHKRFIKGKILKTGVAKSTGYPVVGFANAQKYAEHGKHHVDKIEVHKLVALAFLDFPHDAASVHVHHIDGDKENNRVENLILIPDGEHHRMHLVGKAGNPRKLSTNDVADIRSRLSKGETQQSIADLHGVSQTMISRIKLGKVRKYD